MDILGWQWFPFAGGIAIGVIAGFAARYAHFCSLNAIERWAYAGDKNGLRSWALATLTALVLTQAMVLSGIVDVSQSFYLAPVLGLTGAIAGGLMFGYGMALTGTCSFGALVRLGGGSLKSLVALIMMSIFALAAQKGLLSIFRVMTVDDVAIDLAPARSQSIGDIISALVGIDLALPTAVAVALGLAAFVFGGGVPRKARTRMLAGAVVGVCIAAGWLVTSLAATHAFAPVQIEAGSFVVPVADTVMQIIAYTGVLPDYGVGLVLGVVAGAAGAALIRRDVRWEACDDARELSRHIAGAALMGVGGVMAMGCTIGQAVSAFSVLAISAPIVVVSIVLGARMGLGHLLEGSSFAMFQRRGRAPAE
ncbi:YeeE/YedE family protein [Aestuariivirga sp.]|uniref:YeeE/YedE family protein n=1 Tax=Aestuariivirga sp. TaxID=2650926 RepID=UPI003592F105